MDERTTFKEVLKGAGIKESVAFSDTNELIGYLDTLESAPTWIITHLEFSPTAKYNSFSLSKKLLLDPFFADTKISFIIGEEEQEHILPLFDLGMQNFFKKPFTKNELAKEIEDLLEQFTSPNFNAALVAAIQLRAHFTEKDMNQELIQLEEKLLRYFPTETDLLLKLAEAQMIIEDKEGLKKTLLIAKASDPELRVGVKQLAEMAEIEDEIQAEDASLAEVLGLKTVVIAESDQDHVDICKKALESIGTTDIIHCQNGEEADNHFKEKKDSDLLITEWKLAKVNGLQLLQRLRTSYGSTVPILITSSLLGQKDMVLLSELGASDFIAKPYSQETIALKIITALRERKVTGNTQSLINRFRAATVAKNKEEAIAVFKQMSEGEETLPVGMVEQASAEIAFLNEDYQKARELALESFSKAGESVAVLNILGKALFQLGDTKGAEKCLNRASQLSPDNVRRLSELAVLQAETGNDQAAETLEKANDVDADNPEVIEASAKVAINTGEAELAVKAFDNENSTLSVLAYQNNRGVVLVKEEKIEEALQLYKNAMSVVSDKFVHEKHKVMFNLGLAELRLAKLDDAIQTFKKLSSEAEGELKKRAEALLQKAEQAKASNAPLKFAKKEKASIPLLKPIAYHLAPGSKGLHMIFTHEFSDQKEIVELLNKDIQFHKVKKEAS